MLLRRGARLELLEQGKISYLQILVIDEWRRVWILKKTVVASRYFLTCLEGLRKTTELKQG
jgi:hypothetical protein